MPSMDQPRRSLREVLEQRFQGAEPDHLEVPVPRPESGADVPRAGRDGRGRSPEELFDNLRLSLSDLTLRYSLAPRQEPPTHRDGPPDDAARLDPDPTSAAGAGHGIGTPHEDGTGHADAKDPSEPDGGGTDPAMSPSDAVHAAPVSNAAFPGLGDAGANGELGRFAAARYEEPYRPWFMGGDPSTPWWAADYMP